MTEGPQGAKGDASASNAGAGLGYPTSTVSSLPVSTHGAALTGVAPEILGPPPHPGLLGALGRYEVIRLLGRGGMGVVFLARDSESRKLVALKGLRPEYRTEPRVVDRFLSEARRLQQLKHPNLMPVLDVGQSERAAWFAMPYFERGSLAQLIKPGAPLAGDLAISIARPIAEALRFCHSKGLVHRDVKPGNILLGSDGSVCLADFGLAQSLFNDPVIDVERDQCEGTAPYMSPAVAAGEAEDTRCDIYALGAVLYEMATGGPPYHGENTEAIRGKISAGPPKPICELSPKADARLTQVTEWAMARQLRDRYSCVGDLALDLARVQKGDPPLGPHGIVRGVTRAVRDRVLHGPAGAVLAVLIIIALGTWLLWPDSGSGAVRATTTMTDTNQWVVSSFSHARVTDWWRAIAVECDGLPGKEIVVADKSDLLAFTAAGRLMDSWTCREPVLERLEPLLVSGGQRGDNTLIFASRTAGTNVGISCINQNFHLLGNFTAVGDPPKPSNRRVTSALYPWFVVSPEEARDGRQKLITSLQSNFDGKQRAICCYDFDEGKEVWRCETGASILGLSPLDLDGDGFPDFLFSSHAVGNGYQTSDGAADDQHSYIFALGNSGEKLWQRQFSDLFTSSIVTLGDVNGDGRKEIFAHVRVEEAYHATNAPLRSKVVRLDYEGNPREIYSPGVCFRDCFAFDLNGDSREEIVVLDCEGFAHVLNANLEPERRVQIHSPLPRRRGSLDGSMAQLIAVGHFANEEKVHFLLLCSDLQRDVYTNAGRTDKPADAMRRANAEVVLCDTNLTAIARYRIAGLDSGRIFRTVKAADMDGDRLDEVLLLSDRVEILKYQQR